MTPIDRLAAALKFIHIAPDQNNYDITKVHTIALQEIVEAAQAVIAAYSWQPIETAPKDRDVELVGKMTGELHGLFDGSSHIGIGHYEPRWTDHMGYNWQLKDAGHYAVWMRPYAWRESQPLPEPPAEGE